MRTRAFIAFTVFAGLLAGCSLFLLVNTANAHEEPIIQLAQKEPGAWVILSATVIFTATFVVCVLWFLTALYQWWATKRQSGDATSLSRPEINGRP